MSRPQDRFRTGTRPVADSAAGVMGLAPIAIASVTALLRELLANGVIRHAAATGLGDVKVTLQPPDRISVGTHEPNQLNLFLYRVGSHPILPKTDAGHASGDTRASGSRLAVDLHYLITAYSSQDLHTEILLECALRMMGSLPRLTASMVGGLLRGRSKARTGGLPPAADTLPSLDALVAFEDARVMPQFMSVEEMGRLWSALQARFRPSVVYEVSAVMLCGDPRP